MSLPFGSLFKSRWLAIAAIGITFACQPAARAQLTTNSFRPFVSFNVNSLQESVAIGDLDGDGKADVAAVNYSAGAVSVLRNLGTNGSNVSSNTLSSKFDFPTGGTPRAIVLADVDGDGKLDLIVVNSEGTLAVLRNTSVPGNLGSNAFAARVLFPVAGGNSYALAVGDVDGDGRVDAAVVSAASGTVSVFRNSGTPGITTSRFSNRVDFAVGTMPFAVTIGDVDGDGKADLAVANYNSSTVSILKNTSTLGALTSSSFAPKFDYFVGGNPSGVGLADLSGDGKPELIVANFGVANLSVFINTSTSGVISSNTFAPRVDYDTGGGTYAVAVADYDGDGRPDVAIANEGLQAASVFWNAGSGVLTGRVDYPAGGHSRSIVAGDLNGDGRPDLLVAKTDTSTFSVLQNQPAQVTPPQCVAAPAGLVSSWKGEGNALDSVDGNNGSVVGTLGYAPGKVGQSFLYANNSGQVKVPASSSLNVGAAGALTVEGWIKPSEINDHYPVWEWNSGLGSPGSTAGEGVSLFLSSVSGPGTGPGSLLASYIETNGTPHQLSTPAGTITTNGFQHVAMTYDKASAQALVYVNGVRVLQQTIGSFTPQTSYDFHLGYRPTSENLHFKGQIDEVSVYNRALSSNEVAAIFAAGSAGKCAPTAIPPTITQQPLGQTINVGQTALFTVQATGTQPLAYQWRFGSSNIVGATSSSLVLSNVQLSQAGSYSVVVSNTANTVTSSNAILVVNPVTPPQCSPAPAGLVSAWKGEGNALDTVDGNNGTVVGTLGYAPGKVGQSFSYANNSGHVKIPASANLNVGAGGALTVEGWIKPSEINDHYPIWEWNNGLATPGSAAGEGVVLFLSIVSGPGTGPGSLFVSYMDTNGTPHQVSTPAGTITTNGFQHVAMTYDKTSGQALVYVNGVRVLQQSIGSFTPQTSYDFYLGYRPTSENLHFKGLLDEVSIYNRALSSNEVAAIFVAGSAGKCVTPAPIFVDSAVGPNGHTYYLLQPTTWTQAESNAVALGGHLVTINDQQEDAWVFNRWGTNSLWIGLHDDLSEGNFVWTSGEPLSYTNWRAGEPNDGNGGEDFAYIHPAGFEGAGTWNDSKNESDYIAPEPPPRGVVEVGSGLANFDLSRDYSTNSNPAGVWSYGWKSNFAGAFNLFTFYRREVDPISPPDAFMDVWARFSNDQSAVSHNGSSLTALGADGQAVILPGETLLLPGNNGRDDNYGVIRFTAPVSGSYEIKSAVRNFLNGSLSGDTDFHVLQNGVELFGQFLPPNTATVTNSSGYTNTLSLAVGDTVDFLAGRGSDPDFNGAGLKIQAAVTLVNTNYVPPPTCVSAPAGLVSLWKGEGNALDSVDGNNGTIVGVLNYATGKVGQAFSYNGLSSYVRVPGSSNLNVGVGSGFTLETWINPTSSTATMPLFEWGSYSSGTVAVQFWLSSYGTGNLFANIYDTTGVDHIFVSPNNVIVPNQLQHVALTFDAATGVAKLFRNGTELVSTNLGGPFTPKTTAELYLGKRNGGQTFAGLLDEASIYNRALSSNQIAAIFNAGSAGKCPPASVAPSITQQPVSQIVNVGQGATFTVQATGTQPLRYQWRFGSNNIAGATNSTLVFSSVQPSQAGSYSVVVANTVDIVTSSSALLTVNSSPSFDLSHDFSTNSNPAGVWSYGWKSNFSGVFNLFTFYRRQVDPISPPDAYIDLWARFADDQSAVIHNGSGQTALGVDGQAVLPPGTTAFFPGNNGREDNYGVIRFTAPVSGSYEIKSAVLNWLNGSLSTETDFHVLENGAELFSYLVPASTGTVTHGSGYTNILSLAAGSTIDFLVGRGPDDDFNGAGLKIQAAVTLVNTNYVPPACAPAAVGLVSLWKAEGNALDSAGGNNGTAVGGLGYGPGKVGQAFVFGPTNVGYVKVLASSSLNVGQGSGFTIEAWINPSDISSSAAHPIFEWNNGTGSDGSHVGEGVQFGHSVVWRAGTGAGDLFADVIDPSLNNFYLGTPAATLKTGVWQHVAMVYDKASGRGSLYYNGVKVDDEFLGSYSPQTGYDVYIGYRPTPSGPHFTGAMDEVAVYNRPLSSSEIADIYNADSAGKCITAPQCVSAPAGLVSSWEGEGSALDSVDGNHGVVAGTLGYLPGKVGQAFSYSGTANYVRVPASSNLNVGAAPGFTLEGWINPSSAPSQMPIFEWGTVNGNIGLQFWTSSYGTANLFANIFDANSADHLIYTPDNVLVSQQFQHVAVTYNKSSGVAAIYRNGVKLVEQNIGANLTARTTADLYLGKRVGGQSFNGILDELSVFNRALSTAEIAAIFNAGSAGKCTPQGFGPSITQQPANRSVPQGQTAVFTVQATGSQPLVYQWRFGGTNIVGAVQSSLVLSNLQASQAGSYSVVVANPYGSVPSSSATLSVTSVTAPCTPAPAGLVALWKAEGNTLDSVGVNNGVPAGPVAYTLGKVGRGFSYGSASGYVQVPANPSLDVGQGAGFSLEGWINPSSAPSQMPIFEWGTVDNGVGLQFWTSSYGTANLFANIVDAGGVDHLLYSSNNVLVSQQFQHVAVTFDKATGLARIYRNGIKIAETNFGPGIVARTASELYLGKRIGGQTFSGVLDELSVYNRALQSSEVASIYTAGNGGKCALPPSPPVITQQPVSSTVSEAAVAQFGVGVSGSQPMTFQWRFQGDNLVGANQSSLTLSNVVVAQAGAYDVIIANNYGSVTSAVATLSVDRLRILQIGAVPAQQEGTTITLPLNLISTGDVAGIDFKIAYNTNYLRSPVLEWDRNVRRAFTDLNTNVPGEVRGALVLAGETIPSGVQTIAHLSFFLRSVPTNLTTAVGLQILDMSGEAGDTLVGTLAQGTNVTIMVRTILGDNNANNRLDVGDATAILRYLTGLEQTRPWDITLNNLNGNTSLDSGDAIKALRASALLDAQAFTNVLGGNVAFAAPENAKSLSSVAGNAVLYPAALKSQPGQFVTVEVRLQNVTYPVAGASFSLNYDTNALRLVDNTSYQFGALVPNGALALWNIAPSQNNLATQSGLASMAASSAQSWSSSNGTLAQLTFQVQPGANNRYQWPITLTSVEATEDGYINHRLATAGATLSVRAPVAARLAPSAALVNGKFSLTINGDTGVSYLVEASSDLVTWTPIATVVPANGAAVVTDDDSGNLPKRFYRVRLNQ